MSIELRKALRPVHDFKRVQHVFTKAERKSDQSGELRTVELWKLYEVSEQQDSPPIYVCDDSGLLKDGSCALVPLDKEGIQKVLAEITLKIRNRMFESLQPWGSQIDKDLMFKMGLVMKTAPRLAHPEALKSVNWEELIEAIVNPQNIKDPILALVQTAHLLQGYEAQLNANALIGTNAGVGKNAFYRNHCGEEYVVSKFTSNGLIGYITGDGKMRPGFLQGKLRAVNLDQVESQLTDEALRYVFDGMETGKSVVSTAGASMEVDWLSPLVFTGNAIEKGRALASFMVLLDHLSLNAALGRRIPLILCDENLKIVRTRMSQQEQQIQVGNSELFKAVEEYCTLLIRKIFNDKFVRTWINTQIPGYEDTIKALLENTKSGLVTDFFREHAVGAQNRVRAAALMIAIAESLKELAMSLQSGQTTVTDKLASMLVEEASLILPGIIGINVRSIRNIFGLIERNQALTIANSFNNWPEYARHLLVAVELYRESNPTLAEFNLNDVKYDKDDKPLSYSIHKFLDRKDRRTGQLNNGFDAYFGFRLMPEQNAIVKVRITANRPDAHKYVLSQVKGSSPPNQPRLKVRLKILAPAMDELNPQGPSTPTKGLDLTEEARDEPSGSEPLELVPQHD